VTYGTMISSGNLLRLPGFAVPIVAAGVGLPIALAPRWPLLAWRLSFAGMFLPPLIFPWYPGIGIPWDGGTEVAYLIVAYVLAVRAEPAVAVWAWLLTVLAAAAFVGPVPALAGGSGLAVVMALGGQVRRIRQAQTRLAAERERAEQESARGAAPRRTATPG